MSDTGERIIRQMEAVRHELAEDVDDVVTSAGQAFDWREYVRRYPWAFLGAAAAVGYFVVPSREEIVSPDAETLLALARRNKLVVQANPTPQKRGGLAGTLFSIAANALVRGAVSYLGQQAGRVMSDGASEKDGG
jgi:hypothetical protein